MVVQNSGPMPWSSQHKLLSLPAAEAWQNYNMHGRIGVEELGFHL
jgi:hypothetical protein